MKLVVLDADNAFTTALTQRCKSAGVLCAVFSSPAPAFAEIKKNPDAVDLVLVADNALSLVQELRRDRMTAEVPYILLSRTWSKAEFSKHQKTEFAANAYFNKQSPVTELNRLIEAVTGMPFGGKAQPKPPAGLLNVKLEVASEVLNIREEAPAGIQLNEPIDLTLSNFSPRAPEAQTQSKIEIPVEQSAVVEPKVSKPEVSKPEVSEPRVELKFDAPAEPAAPQPSIDSAGPGIEISLAGESFQVETSKLLASSATDNDSSIELGGSAQLTVAASSPPALVREPKPEPVVAQPESESQVAPLSLEPSLQINEPSASSAKPSAPPLAAPLAQHEPEPESEPGVAVEPVNATLPESSDDDVASDLPYLFPASQPANQPTGLGGFHGGTATLNISQGADNDIDTLKKYLMMREQDVALLTAQLGYAKEELAKSEASIKQLTLQNEDLMHQANVLKEKVETQSRELQHAGRSRDGEVEQLRLEVKSKIDRIKFLEEKLNDSAHEYEQLKERVRLDIRKIRVREKELESKLEILKKDSETLIAARENRILELKRKIDLLEFNYDALQDKNDLEKQNVEKANEKLSRVFKALKLALGTIDSGEEAEGPDSPSGENAA